MTFRSDGLPLHVHSPHPSQGQPITVGVPFPRAVLTEPFSLQLRAADGALLVPQTKTLARWPDGSVRWLLLDFLLTDSPSWTLENSALPAPPNMELRVGQAGEALLVASGVTTFYVDGSLLRPLSKIVGQGFATTDDTAHLELVLVEKGKAFSIRDPALHHLAVEETGPVRTTLCLSGQLDRPARCRFEARLCFFAGTSLVRLRLTLHNPEAARHEGGLWDLDDPASQLFVSAALLLPWFRGDQPRLHWSLPHLDGVRQLRQDDSGDPAQPTSRPSPVLRVEGTNLAVTVALPEFWQQFPRGLAVTADQLRIDFWPRAVSPPHQLQGGERKTHTVWLHFGPPRPDGPLPLTWVHRPAVVTLPAEWYRQCGVLPHLPAVDPASPLDALVGSVVEGAQNWFAKREIIGEYGWRNYGEVYADHENAHATAPRPIVSHYNNQYDVLLGLLTQYCRTGDVRFWALSDPLARHVYDIDIYHTTRDKARFNGGMFWHTDHYQDAATCTHRAYSKANVKPGQPYGGGPSCEHNFTSGLLLYHYLTGDPLARAAVLELANWVFNMDDGWGNILGVVDDGPTGHASATRDPSFNGPGRGAANSINALLDAWLLSDDPSFLAAAEVLVRRCIHPHDDLSNNELLDIENRWSYTVFLSVLCRYLDLKAQAGQLDERYAYARAALLHYAEWMERHERPYFDQPEKLEYPTETWAAQELRKGNVLRLAARFAEEPSRLRLWQRGAELTRRAWADLLGFESRFTARPLAIAMREGPVALALDQEQPAPAPLGPACDFGQPQVFVPQKQRVKALLRSPLGLVTVAGRLLNPWRWWKYARQG